MKTPFVINPEAPQSDLSFELNNHLHELEETLFMMGVAAHTVPIAEGAILAISRQVRQIKALVETITAKKEKPVHAVGGQS